MKGENWTAEKQTSLATTAFNPTMAISSSMARIFPQSNDFITSLFYHLLPDGFNKRSLNSPKE